MNAHLRHAAIASLLASLTATSAGCGGGPISSAPAAPARPPGDPKARQALDAELSKVINDATARYTPLAYSYSEDLLAKLDKIEAHRPEGSEERPTRFLPRLDEREELAHFREAIRRWESENGRSLRQAIEPLKAEVAARPAGGPAFNPDFQRRFSASLDRFVAIEVGELRERRNRAIHDRAGPILDARRAEHPELVREYEAILDKQYPRPTGSARPRA